MEFIVLPDSELPSAVTQLATRWPNARILRHASGRPWLVGQWSDDTAVHISAGANQLVLLGRFLVNEEAVRRRLGAIRDVAGVDDVIDKIPGAFHAIASVAGEVRVQGDISTSLRVFRTAIDGATVAADRPERIAALAGSSIDESALALRMLIPYGPPWPLNNVCVWRGVHIVNSGDYLRIRPDGAHRTVRWWAPPEPHLSLAEGVARVRAALIDAVTSCDGQQSMPLSFDLSGGMDSTSLCFLSSEIGQKFTTISHRSMDPSNDDAVWVKKSLPLLNNKDHIYVDSDSMSGFYDALENPGSHPASLEGPYHLVPNPTMAHFARLSAQAGARRHITGHGSDELFRNGLAFLNACVRAHPLRSIGHLRWVRAQARLSLSATFRTLRKQPDFDSWLRQAHKSVTGAPSKMTIGWDFEAKLPDWVSPEATAMVRHRFADATGWDSTTFGNTLWQHDLVRQVQTNGAIIGQCSRIGEQFGVSFEAPYTDRMVVEAAMSIRLPDRISHGANKPILAAAMSGTVPHDVLNRDYKGTPTQDIYQQLHSLKAAGKDLVADSRLADLGLIDKEKLRATVFGLHRDLFTLYPLNPTLACEAWLRSTEVRELSLTNSR